jgi:hypothetical protein
MSWPNLFEPDNSSRICFTLLHSLWQVALAALIAGVVSRLWRKSSVEWSYTVHLAALVVGLAALPTTYSLLPAGLPQAREVGLVATIADTIPADAAPAANTPNALPAPRERLQSAQKENELAPIPREDLTTAAQRPTPWQRMTTWLAGIYATGKPTYCVKPIDAHAWKITPDEHRSLPDAMAGRSAYPLSDPVDLMLPQRETKPPHDRTYGGDAFLFVTREGTAGLLRMTAQVTDTNDSTGSPYGVDPFSPTGFYRGAKISFATMTEGDDAPKKESGNSFGSKPSQ